jgi:hypothetical protein
MRISSISPPLDREFDRTSRLEVGSGRKSSRTPARLPVDADYV